jgi:hypothetical protein
VHNQWWLDLYGGNFDLSVTPVVHLIFTISGNNRPANNLGSSGNRFSELQYRSIDSNNEYRVWVNADESGCEDVYSSVTVTYSRISRSVHNLLGIDLYGWKL